MIKSTCQPSQELARRIPAKPNLGSSQVFRTNQQHKNIPELEQLQSVRAHLKPPDLEAKQKAKPARSEMLRPNQQDWKLPNITAAPVYVGSFWDVGSKPVKTFSSSPQNELQSWKKERLLQPSVLLHHADPLEPLSYFRAAVARKDKLLLRLRLVFVGLVIRPLPRRVLVPRRTTPPGILLPVPGMPIRLPRIRGLMPG